MKININTASVEELQLVPRTRKKKAEAIIAFRTQYGRINKEALALTMMGDLREDVLNVIDFSMPSTHPDRLVASGLTRDNTVVSPDIQAEINESYNALKKLLSYTHPSVRVELTETWSDQKVSRTSPIPKASLPKPKTAKMGSSETKLSFSESDNSDGESKAKPK